MMKTAARPQVTARRAWNRDRTRAGRGCIRRAGRSEQRDASESTERAGNALQVDVAAAHAEKRLQNNRFGCNHG